MKNGTGNPALCRAHWLLVNDAARRSSAPGPHAQTGQVFQRVGSLAADFIDDFFAGRPFNVEKAKTAINEAARDWAMGGGYVNFSPPLEDVPFQPPGSGPEWARDAQRNAQTAQNQRRWWDPQNWANAHEEPADPAAHERQQVLERARQARIVLGFGPRDAITEQILKKRHRELSLKHHPDRPGGNAKRMAEINNAVDALAATL